MSIHLQTSKTAPAELTHGLSMHPKVRAVIEKGLEHEWVYKDVAELLQLSERSAHNLFESKLLKVSRYPAKSVNGCLRRVTGLSLLLYLLEHTDEITEADVRPILKKVLPLLTNDLLTRVSDAAQALIRSRSGMPVVVKAAPKRSNVIDAQTEFSLFPPDLTTAAESA